MVKPQGVPSQPDKTKDTDMTALVQKYLQMQYPKAHHPYVGLIHRLDRAVGGVMVFAKTKPAAAALSKQIAEKQFEKIYSAVVCGAVAAEQTTVVLIDYLVKNERLNLSRVTDKGNRFAKEAVLSYRLVQQKEELSLLVVTLNTGRHHQIRVQLSHCGLPIYGDAKYNPAFQNKQERIALWATRSCFNHPKTQKRIIIESKPDFYPFTLFQ